jgi:metal-sulfur cluster biosynthetic enzyme
MQLTEEYIKDYLRPIEDPDLGMSLVDMGLIYEIKITDGNKIHIKMTLSSPACPIGDQLASTVENYAKAIEGVKDVTVEIVWDPPWDPETMASDEIKDMLGLW